jgi:hypothetical protein
MQLSVAISAPTLTALVQSLMPLRIELGGDAGSERHLTLSAPERIELVAGWGLRLACSADVCWPVLGMRLPVPIRAIAVVLEPRVSRRRGVSTLVFGLHVEGADLGGVPAALSARIIDWVNVALREREVALAWKVQDAFERSFPLPAMLSSLRSFDLALDKATVVVSESELRVGFDLAASITRA